jgi:hypothetical protein
MPEKSLDRFGLTERIVNATDEMSAAAEDAAPFSEMMLIMDLADTIEHDPTLADDPTRLRAAYAGEGLAVPDNLLAAGIEAFRQRRFAHVQPPGGAAVTLARLYVGRRRWLPAVRALTLMFLISFGGYFFVYKPFRDGQLEQARIELAQTMPAQMDALYSAIFDETKVQQAANDAGALRDRGKAAAQKGDRAGAEAAISAMTALRDTLRAEYQLTIVDRPGAKWGFWSIPQDNTDETNYYLVVEARTPEAKVLSLPIRNEPTGKFETVAIWGIRVPEAVYRSVEADKSSDGIIQRPLVGVKQFGFLDVDFVVQVLGGTVTRW